MNDLKDKWKLDSTSGDVCLCRVVCICVRARAHVCLKRVADEGKIAPSFGARANW